MALAGCASPQKPINRRHAEFPSFYDAYDPERDSPCGTVRDKIFFDFDSSAITEQAALILKKQACWLALYPRVNVVIAGNSDERGTEKYNLALGYRRANADRDVLVALGVARRRITVVSYGEERPLAEGDNEAAWAQNRNATTSLQKAGAARSPSGGRLAQLQPLLRGKNVTVP
jgi:peptidoglycan-associated lipoprotein